MPLVEHLIRAASAFHIRGRIWLFVEAVIVGAFVILSLVTSFQFAWRAASSWF